MRLDLSHIRQPDTSVVRQYEPAAVAGDDDEYRIVAPVSLVFTVHKDQDRFRLVGTVTTRLELVCGRCLEPFALPVQASFDLRFLPRSAGSAPLAAAGDDEDGVEGQDDDVATTFYDDDEIDLGALVREQFYLALPMKPLCRESCKGLCPQCGVNLNTDSCTCSPRWEDPRLSGLKALISERKHDDA
ncbi:MAG: DUF177 domain-containing protein [Acidobacteria bacterium]|nr:DUF177 domain-containing protein [Acidobacteriota bacterium]